jgi:hypothetical protein
VSCIYTSHPRIGGMLDVWTREVMIWSYHAQDIAQSPRACVHDAHAPLIAQFQESLRGVSRGRQARVLQRQRQPAGRHTTAPDCPGCGCPATLQAHHHACRTNCKKVNKSLNFHFCTETPDKLPRTEKKVSSLPGWRRTNTGRTQAKTGGESNISLARTSICIK